MHLIDSNDLNQLVLKWLAIFTIQMNEYPVNEYPINLLSKPHI